MPVTDYSHLREDVEPEDAPITDEERARTQKEVVRLLAAFVAVAIAAAVVFFATHHNSSGGNDSVDTGGAISADPTDAIGPVAGIELATYTQRRQVALKNVKTARATAVSFSQYMSEADAHRLLQGYDVRALLVAAPGSEPEVVRGALAQWATSARQDFADQKTQFQDLLKDTKDPEFIKQYQSEVARLDRLEKSLTPTGPIVFGAVLVADPGALQRLSTTTGVRLVDVSASSHIPADSNIHGLRPEETFKAGTPLTRPF
ncbi:MAG: hypothetical protein JO054_12885 [Actinobacteria bacterium]|nr:hypothetical protein [Actinomycetota bacterium]MBV9255120.1 hypothetical protein [Actinomycetota bacterium]